MTMLPDDVDNQADTTALLGELLASKSGAASDNRQQALMQMMSLMQQPEPHEPRPDRDHQRRRRRAAKIRRHIEELEAEVDELRHRNDALAAALGACHVCWGEHDGCATCSGRGQPGWFRPDVATSRQIIGPAIERLRFEQRRARPLTKPPSPREAAAPQTTNQPSDIGKDTP